MNTYAIDMPSDRNIFSYIYDNCYSVLLTNLQREKIMIKKDQAHYKFEKRMAIVLDEKLNLENCDTDDIYYMQEKLSTSDLQCQQYQNLETVLNTFLSANGFYHGRKTNRGIEDVIGEGIKKFKCKCKHKLDHHNGDFGERACGMGCGCKEFENKKAEEELATISCSRGNQKFIDDAKIECPVEDDEDEDFEENQEDDSPENPEDHEAIYDDEPDFEDKIVESTTPKQVGLEMFC